jgi:DNA-binding response OmpR family regulator
METSISDINAKPKRILVVDDDKDLNLIICEELRFEGYEVLSALDGKHAIELAREVLPDVILMDIMMPGLDGINTCKFLKNDTSTSSIPMIMISAKTDMQTKLTSFTSGAKRYLAKPFQLEDLIDEIKKVLEQKELSRKIRDYHEKCKDDGDFGVFSSDFKCDETKNKG